MPRPTILPVSSSRLLQSPLPVHNIIESDFCSDEADASSSDDEDMIYPSEYENFIGDIYEVPMVEPPVVHEISVKEMVAGVEPPVLSFLTAKVDQGPPVPFILNQQCPLNPNPLDVDELSLLTASVAPEILVDLPRHITLDQDISEPVQEEKEEEGHHRNQPEEEEPLVTVGLSQVTLFPSHTLKIEEKNGWFLPDTECLQLSLCGICCDEDQMISSAAGLNKNKKMKYVPPPVTWSQPAIVVPPAEGMDDDDTIDDEEEKEGKKVHFKDCRKRKVTAPSRMMLLHGRVARALGIFNGDLVVAQFQGQTKRQFYKASVDDRASFNVVIEADWKEIVDSYSTVTPSGMKKQLKAPKGTSTPLRYVDLKVMEDADEESDETNRNARFLLTPSDGLRHGVLYFDGSLGVSPVKGGLVAGTGFCVYSCRNREDRQDIEDALYKSDYDESDSDSGDDDDLSSVGRSVVNDPRMPAKCNALVSSFRYLGRPFCPNHAEYSALIEGLEWLFRFQFDKVTIMGAPEVISAFRKTSKDGQRSPKISKPDIPQLQRAHNIAQGMINKAARTGLEIDFVECFQTEQWEATELAEKALKKENNECQVMWDYICEARAMDAEGPSRYAAQSSLTYSEDSGVRRQSLMTIDLDAEKSDDWTLLRGEEVLDSDFLSNTTSPLDRLDRLSHRVSVEIENVPSSEEPTTVNSSVDEEIPADEAQASYLKNQNVGQETKEVAVAGESSEPQVEVDDPTGPKGGRGSARWKNFSKALRYRRASNKYTSINSQSDEASLQKASAEDSSSLEKSSTDDDRSTWIDPPTCPPSQPSSSKNKGPPVVHGTCDYDGEEKVNDDDDYPLPPKLPRRIEASFYSDGSDSVSSEGFPKPLPEGHKSLCYFLDLDLLQGAQLVADDVMKLLVGEDSAATPATAHPAAPPPQPPRPTTTQKSMSLERSSSEYEKGDVGIVQQHSDDDAALHPKRYAYV